MFPLGSNGLGRPISLGEAYPEVVTKLDPSIAIELQHVFVMYLLHRAMNIIH